MTGVGPRTTTLSAEMKQSMKLINFDITMALAIASFLLGGGATAGLTTKMAIYLLKYMGKMFDSNGQEDSKYTMVGNKLITYNTSTKVVAIVLQPAVQIGRTEALISYRLAVYETITPSVLILPYTLRFKLEENEQSAMIQKPHILLVDNEMATTIVNFLGCRRINERTLLIRHLVKYQGIIINLMGLGIHLHIYNNECRVVIPSMSSDRTYITKQMDEAEEEGGIYVTLVDVHTEGTAVPIVISINEDVIFWEYSMED
eukprot:GHVS01042719.1.p1 GENE.GHVS01042719.1~~GHVS01042719.1.p1  ORF type:complete len:259 (+),score=30.99 GHVS01042719.1:539-1315(+)